MAGVPEAEDRMAALLATHKQEKKELQGKTLSMKKSISKTDKKKKKALNDEIEKMEQALNLKHKEEVEALQTTLNSENAVAVDQPADAPAEAPAEVPAAEQAADELRELSVREPRVSKAQRRRDKKAEEARQREVRIAEQEVLNRDGPRMRETVAIKERLRSRGQVMHEVPSDGDCLYSAVRHQLGGAAAGDASVSALRRRAAEELQQNDALYRPFLTDPSTGEMYSDEGYSRYCHLVANSPAWGGMTEVAALSAVLQRPIEVIQAEGPPVVLGNDREGQSLLITYHRHMFGLGEHYNSTRELTQDDLTDSD